MTADPGEDAAADLEATALRSVLLDEPLPGLGHPISLADIGMAIDSDGNVRLLAGGHAEAVATTLNDRLQPRSGHRNVALVDEDELSRSGDPLAAVVRVSSTAQRDTVAIRLEIAAMPTPTSDLVPLEAVTVVFTRLAGSWTVAEPPRHVAM